MLAELDSCIENVILCNKFAHNGSLSLAVEADRLRELPSTVLDQFNMWEAIEEMSGRAEAESLNSPASDTANDLCRSLLG